ncbi:MAG: exo-alpha-sialidase [Oscillospiraceae bacterium]|nr:exo-alpha-sialidase [Oscillospiraceae bacterium]
MALVLVIGLIPARILVTRTNAVEVVNNEPSEADKKAAKEVDEKIDAIGTVTLESEFSIKAARSAYALLTQIQKGLVEKLAILENAEITLKNLQNLAAGIYPNYAFAVFSEGGITDDGLLKEAAWRLNNPITGSQKFGVVWDFDNLYIGVTSGSTKVPNGLTDMKINGIEVGVYGTNGIDSRELTIPLSAIGIDEIDFTKEYDLTFTLDKFVWEGKLIFDKVGYEVQTINGSIWETTSSAGKTEGALKSDQSTEDGFRMGFTYASDKLTPVMGSTTVLEFDLKVNAMPDDVKINQVGPYFVQGGINLLIRDDDTNVGANGFGTEAMMIGFAKQNGRLHFIYWDDAAGKFQTIRINPYKSTDYHVRVEYTYTTNDDVAARFFVNGGLVAQIADAKKIGEDGFTLTTATNLVQVVAYGVEAAPVDAVVSNFSISHPQEIEAPAPLSRLTPQYIFGRLDLGHIEYDLPLIPTFVGRDKQEYTLTWISSDETVVAPNGKINRHATESKSAKITLKVGNTELWSVDVTVEPRTKVEQESAENVDAAFSKAEIVIDGLLKEEGWRMAGRVLDADKLLVAEYGFQWNQTHLFVAVDFTGEFGSVELTLNGKTFTIEEGKLKMDNAAVADAQIAVKNGIAEIAIPMQLLGFGDKITEYGKSMEMSIKAGGFTGAGKKLSLASFDWFVTDNRDHAAVVGSTKSTDEQHGVQQLVNGWRLFDLFGGTNTKAKVRSFIGFMTDPIYVRNFADRVYDTRLEFDFQAHALPVLSTDVTDKNTYVAGGGAYGNSGFTCAFGEIADAQKYSYTFNIGIVNTEEGLLFVVTHGKTETYKLNKQVGDKFSVAVEWAYDNTLELFVDGVLVKTFEGVANWKKGAGNASLVVNMRPLTKRTSEADNFDVSITNIAFGKVHTERNLIAQLDFDDIQGENETADQIVDDLVLPGVLTNGQMDKEYQITWTSDNNVLNPQNGKVTRPASGSIAVKLTATLENGESKSFDLVVLGGGISNDNVLNVPADANPATGVGVAYPSLLYTFDENNNSIIAVLSEKQKVNSVVLTDGDDKARLSAEFLSLWISDDNVTYTRVPSFKLLQVNENWYLYDFEAEGKYVKVHYQQDDSTGSDFIGTYGNMIKAGYEKVFGGGDATFVESTYTLTNSFTTTKYDYAWTISKSDLGIIGTDASIRISLNGSFLYHYVDGENVIVRVPELAPGASVKLTVQQSNSQDVLDIANKENVYEIIYGNRELTLTSSRWYYLTLPAGTTFPDGSKLEKETIYRMRRGYFSTSTDGGTTWSKQYSALDNAPEGKKAVEKMGEGGWMFDDVTGRLMFENYVSYTGFDPYDMMKSHMETQIVASDDGGKTWYILATLPCRCMEEYKDNTNIPTYALSYSDGIKLSTYDGKDGPNVDFVFPLGSQYDNIGSFACRVAYTTDAGETWQYSKTQITYPSEYGSEGGCSEAYIIEREDGVLVLHVRCQEASVYHFKVCYSLDWGLTWTNDHIFTDYFASNGQAVIKEMEVNGEKTILSVWGGNNAFGGGSYHRNPFNFATSANDAETFRNIQNIVSKTWMEQYESVYYSNTTNVSLTKYDEDNMLLTFRRNAYSDFVEIRVEDFDAWLTRTKGAYDDFEHGNIRYEGWGLRTGAYELSDKNAHGKYSMKVTAGSVVTRCIPYLQNGKLSIDIYAAADSSFTLQLQSAFDQIYGNIAMPIGLRVENGKLYLNKETTAIGELAAGWNTLSFDLELTEDKAGLSVNGAEPVEIPVRVEDGDYVCFITISTAERNEIFVDDLLVISDLEPVISATEDDKKAANEVIDLIKAIAEAEDKATATAAARAAFDKLSQVQADLVDRRVLLNRASAGLDGLINYYEVLVAAESGKYEGIEEIVDQAAAGEVHEMILAIGKVTLASKSAIVAARQAYDALTAEQKLFVNNYKVLTDAETAFKVLEEKDKEPPKTMDTTPVGLISVLMIVSVLGIVVAMVPDIRRKLMGK